MNGDEDSIFSNLPPRPAFPLPANDYTALNSVSLNRVSGAYGQGPLTGNAFTPELNSMLASRKYAVRVPANPPPSPATGSFAPTRQQLQSDLDFHLGQANKQIQTLTTTTNPDLADVARQRLQDHSDNVQRLRDQLSNMGPKSTEPLGGGLPLSAPQLVAHPVYGGISNLEQHLQHLRDMGVFGGTSE
jgi:hypothetical protein